MIFNRKNKKNIENVENIKSSKSIKNLVFGKFKKNAKYSLKKVAVVGVILGLTLLPFGYNAVRNNAISNNNSVNIVTTDEAESSIVYSKGGEYTNEKIADSLSVTDVTLEKEFYNYFAEYILDYDVEFPLEEMYNYEESTEFFEQERESVTDHTYSGFIKDGKVDEEKLFESVKENSPIFRTEKKHYIYTLIDDDEKLKLIVSYVAEALNEVIPTKSDEELEVLDCVLGELTIFYGGGSASAEVTDENALLVNESMIDAVEITTSKEEAYRDIIYHEAMHLAQVDCIDYENANYKQQGISRSTDELDVNAYSWLWSTEAGAEKGSMNITGDEPTFYNYLVGYMETLDMIGITSDYSSTGSDVEETTTSRDIDRFYNLMGINSGITKEEIVKMMYSMDIMQGKISNFDEQYEEYMGVELSSAEFAEIKKDIRRQFLLENSKIFYVNLANKMLTTSSVTLEDVYYLISLFEADIDYHLEYLHNDVLNDSASQKFLEEYTNIQSKFFEALVLSNDLDYDDLIEDFNNYAMYAYDSENNVVINASLEWLNTSQKEWLQEKANSSRITFAKPINVVVDDIKQQLSK